MYDNRHTGRFAATKMPRKKAKMKRAPEFEIDPFLLPTCNLCGGPLNLSYVEPKTDQAPARRIYRCLHCGAEKLVQSTDSRDSDSSRQRGG
jgi:hypothetical protein